MSSIPCWYEALIWCRIAFSNTLLRTSPWATIDRARLNETARGHRAMIGDRRACADEAVLADDAVAADRRVWRYERISPDVGVVVDRGAGPYHGKGSDARCKIHDGACHDERSEEHTSELQSLTNLV